jgi:hypothetical protein
VVDTIGLRWCKIDMQEEEKATRSSNNLSNEFRTNANCPAVATRFHGACRLPQSWINYSSKEASEISVVLERIRAKAGTVNKNNIEGPRPLTAISVIG